MRELNSIYIGEAFMKNTQEIADNTNTQQAESYMPRTLWVMQHKYNHFSLCRNAQSGQGKHSIVCCVSLLLAISLMLFFFFKKLHQCPHEGKTF